jgi:hypothetical protein
MGPGVGGAESSGPDRHSRSAANAHASVTEAQTQAAGFISGGLTGPGGGGQGDPQSVIPKAPTAAPAAAPVARTSAPAPTTAPGAPGAPAATSLGAGPNAPAPTGTGAADPGTGVHTQSPTTGTASAQLLGLTKKKGKPANILTGSSGVDDEATSVVKVLGGG